MTTRKPKPAAPEGLTSLGGTAFAHPSLEPLIGPISAVSPYPGNPRRGDQDAITGSITDHGLYTGVVAQRSTGRILVGNHRYHALTALGAESIPVTWVDVDDVRAAAIVARDNRTSDQGSYDNTDLLTLLRTLAADDALPSSGYDEKMIDTLTSLVDLPVDMSGQVDPDSELRAAGVLDFDNADGEPVFQVKVSFASLSDYEDFRRRLDYTGPRRSRVWFPEQPDLIESEIEHVAAEA